MSLLRFTDPKAAGYITIADPDAPLFEAETVQCCHCQKHWAIRPGSGAERGFCRRCNGVICGKRHCFEHCVPWERMIEEIEIEHHGAKNLALAMERLREPDWRA